MHLDLETLELLVHGELKPEDRGAVEAHVAACPECQKVRTRLEDEGRQMLSRLAMLDEPTPPVEVSELIARANRRRPSRLRWAAGILLSFVAAGGIYAAPGSPVPSWVARFTGIEPRVEEVVQNDVSGVVVSPGPSLEIVFLTFPESGSVTFVLTEAAEVSVRAENGPATFDLGSERLVIDGGGSPADYRITMPIGAPRIQVRVGETEVFALEAGQVTTLARSLSAGTYVLPFDVLR